MKYFLIFGKDPQLSLEEAKAIFKVSDVGENSAIIETDLSAEEAIDTLGGSIKIGEILGTVSGNSALGLIQDRVLNNISVQNKLSFGISDYAKFFKSEKEYFLLNKQVKKQIVKARFVLNYPALTTVQVEKNNLMKKGFELVIFRAGDKIYLGKTLAVQDFEDYSQRDFGRPCRPMDIGIMPIKLVKILINLTTKQVSKDYLSAPLILDPFCGSGTIVQESLLLNFKSVGSDISEEMVSCARKNIGYIAGRYAMGHLRSPDNLITRSDAVNLPFKDASIDFIVTEGYLGKRWVKMPSNDELKKEFLAIEELQKGFLAEARRVLKKGGRCGLTLPIVGETSPNIIDEVKKLSYSTLDLNLIYRRPDQIVGRKIIILEK